jgi:hypothetical protein
MPPSAKRGGPTGGREPPAKKNRRTEAKMTTEEIRMLIPNDVKRYVQDSKVWYVLSSAELY